MRARERASGSGRGRGLGTPWWKRVGARGSEAEVDKEIWALGSVWAGGVQMAMISDG